MTKWLQVVLAVIATVIAAIGLIIAAIYARYGCIPLWLVPNVEFVTIKENRDQIQSIYFFIYEGERLENVISLLLNTVGNFLVDIVVLTHVN